MRYGLISDIHSNLEAFDAVTDFLSGKQIDSYLCCGDIVGYGPDPNECIKKIRSIKNIRIVLGNHDAACCGLKDLTWFNDYAQEAILWTRKVLTAENRAFLRGLPLTYSEDEFIIVHGSPRDPLGEYLLTKRQFSENIPLFDTQICFAGHSHVPLVWRYDTGTGYGEFITVTTAVAIKTAKEYKFIVNTGGVGQPRDSDVRAACVVYDSDAMEVTFYRVDYAYIVTQEKMKRQNLPRFLIERLGRGR